MLLTAYYKLQHAVPILPTEFIYGVRITLRINTDHFHKQRKPVEFVTETRPVFFAARTGFLNRAYRFRWA
jgi:hypothetical protein